MNQSKSYDLVKKKISFPHNPPTIHPSNQCDYATKITSKKAIRKYQC